MKNWRKASIIILLLTFLFAGCYKSNPVGSEVATATEALTPSSFATSTIKKVVQSTTPPTSTITPSSTPTLKPTSTKAVIPTLTTDDAKADILNLLDKNNDCQLPCVWGITPGTSTQDLTTTFFKKYGSSSKPRDFYIETNRDITAILWQNDLRAFTSFTPYFKDGVVENLVLYAEFTQEQGEGVNQHVYPVFGNPFFTKLFENVLIRKILTNYGEPSEILIYPFWDDPDAPYVKPLFSLVIVNREHGFLIEYLLPKELSGNDFIGCPAKAGYFSLITWQPNRDISLEEMVKHNSGLGINSLNMHRFKPLTEVTAFSIDSFYKTFTVENNKACIATPKTAWEIP